MIGSRLMIVIVSSVILASLVAPAGAVGSVAPRPLAPVQGEGGSSPCAKPYTDPILCPPQNNQTDQFVSCLADGLLVTESDLLGGSLATPYSQSRAWATLVPGVPAPPTPPFPLPATIPPPPASPQAHADAQQLGVDYTTPLIGATIHASVVNSRCDVSDVGSPGAPFGTQAYGRGAVHDLSVNAPILAPIVSPITASLLNFETNAYGTSPPTAGLGTWAFSTCDVHELNALSPLLGSNTITDWCTAPNTGASLIVVSVVANEEWGPIPVGTGAMYGGDVLHVTITVPAVAVVNVYVGYVQTLVSGALGAPLGPNFYVPASGPCWEVPPIPAGVTCA
jgi:hypothetical protein